MMQRTSFLLLAGLFASLPPIARAGEGQAAASTAEVVVPSGPYHFGALRFATASKQAMELQIQFRGGRAIASQIILDGKYFSPPATGQYGMDPLIERCNLEGLRLNGKTLTGDFKWESGNGKAETVPLEGTVNDGHVIGKAGGADLSGWLRSDEQMARVNGFAAGKDWPAWTGPTGDWSGPDSDRPLVDDCRDARLAWFSEASFGAGRDGRRDLVRYMSGTWSPILGDGRIFALTQKPAGDVVDEALADGLNKDWLQAIHGELDPVAIQARKDGARPIARVDADDAIICIDAAGGKTLWTTAIKGRSFMPAICNKHCDENRTGCYAGGKVFVLGRTFRLYALDAASGKLLWESALPKTNEAWEKKKQQSLATKTALRAPPEYPPLGSADGVVFCHAPSDGGILGFDAASGKHLWTLPGDTPARWTNAGKNYVVFMAAKGLSCADPKTGETVWTAAVDGDPRGALYLRLLESHLLTSVSVRGKPHVTVCYLLEKTGPKKLWELVDDADYSLFKMHSCAARDGVAYIRYSGPGSGSIKAKVLSVELNSGKVLGRADIMGTFIGTIEVGNGRVFVQPDGCHCTSAMLVYSAPDLKPLGGFVQPHVQLSAYDAPMVYPYADGRFILRGRNRIFCYDLRKPAE